MSLRPIPKIRRTLSLPGRRIGTAIAVIKVGDHEGPGLRHWTPDLWSSPGELGSEDMSKTACDESVAGMVLTSGTTDDLSCEDCIVEYVRRHLMLNPDDDIEIGR